ncbi:MAG: alpha/beta hydrolase [Nitrospinae bacterium]|nr:alpha/beta hydrolase [Nitrospinota bacterium]
MATQMQPHDKTLTVDGLQLHYLDWGTAGKPPIVLLHGLRGHAHSWDSFSAAICEDYHVLALDQRGRGDSNWAKDGVYTTEAYVSDLLGFSEALKLGSFILVGHSMGGRNGIAFSARYPGKVQKLIIVDIGPVSDPRGSERIRREIVEAPEQFDSFESALEQAAKQNPYAPPEVLRRRVLYQTKPRPDGTIGWRYDPAIRELWRRGTRTSEDLWPPVRRITCPTLIVRGVETDILNPEVAHQMLDAMPTARLVEIPRATHMVFEDNPDDFLAAVRDFLKRG